MNILRSSNRMLAAAETIFLLLFFMILFNGCVLRQASHQDKTIAQLTRQGAPDYKVRPELKPEKDHLSLARELVAGKMYAIALGQLNEAEKSGVVLPEINYLKGRCHLGLSDYNKAVEAFKKAIAVDRKHAPSYGGLGLAYDLSGRRDLAWEAYEKAIEMDPAIAGFHNNIGFSKLAAGKYEEAEAHFLRSLSISGGSATTRNNLAFSYALQGRYDKAMGTLTQRDSRASALSNLGVFYELAGDPVNAARCYRPALTEDGNLKEARENLAALEAPVR